MVDVNIDNKSFTGKNVKVSNWNGKDHKGLVYAFSDDPNQATETIKNE
jgi:hypothetical protein